jgi:hypothetical protein
VCIFAGENYWSRVQLEESGSGGVMKNNQANSQRRTSNVEVRTEDKLDKVIRGKLSN